MARSPEILRTFTAFSGTVLRTGTVPRELKQLVAYIASNAAGCRYCQAHTSATAARVSGSAERSEHAADFESSGLFTEAERAALRLARDSAIQPNAATGQHFDELRQHYTEAEIVEIMAVIGLFGFLNRWNDSMATDLEEEPTAFGAAHLAAGGWSAGKHRV